MDITKIFKSKTREAIFRLLFTNPESSYYLRELERLLSIPVSMIRKELMRLEKEGIVASSRKGNLVFYSLNKTYPLFEEIKSIVMKTVGAAGLLKEALSKINGIEVCFIYGSFAKSQERAGSDIDLFIVGQVDEDALIREIKRIEELLRREINYVIFTYQEYKKRKKAKDAFIHEILGGPKIFLIGEQSEL